MQKSQLVDFQLAIGNRKSKISLVSEPNPDRARGVHQLAIGPDGLQLSDRLGHVDGYDATGAQSDHLSEFTARDEFHGGNSEAGGQHTIEG